MTPHPIYIFFFSKCEPNGNVIWLSFCKYEPDNTQGHFDDFNIDTLKINFLWKCRKKVWGWSKSLSQYEKLWVAMRNGLSHIDQSYVWQKLRVPY